MARQIDTLLLCMAVIGCLSIANIWSYKINIKKSIKHNIRSLGVILVVIFAGAIFILNMQTELNYRYKAVENNNKKMTGLTDYALAHKASFFYYDANAYISSSDYVFKTYQKGKILNIDSLGSWNVRSPLYYERNSKYGFKNSIDGLTNSDKEVYYVSVDEPPLGIKKVLKNRYNKQLVLVETIETVNRNTNIYMVVDDD